MTKSHPTCPDVGGYNDNGVPIAGSLSLQHIMLIAGGACTAVTLALSLSLLFKHLHRYTVPSEQRQIVRLIFTPVVFAVFNLLGIAFYHASIYITPIADLYEAFALASFFLLLVNYVVPDATQQEAFFAVTEHQRLKGEPISGSSLSLFKVYDIHQQCQIDETDIYTALVDCRIFILRRQDDLVHRPRRFSSHWDLLLHFQ